MIPERRTWIVASLGGQGTQGLLKMMRSLAAWVDAVEVRLDLSPPVDLPRLLTSAPLPVIVTYRPQREGGRYRGKETHRLRVLEEAARLGAAAVDVEWDSSHLLGNVAPALRIVSRHFFSGMPADPWAEWQRLAEKGADVVKIAAYAHTLSDALRMCELFLPAERPTIIIAMGRAGMISRLLAPFYPSAFLTFGAPDREHGVAPGQISVQDLHERFHLHRLNPQSTVYGYLAPDAIDAERVIEQNRRWQAQGGNRVMLPLEPTDEDDVHAVLQRAWELGFSAILVAPPFLRALGLASDVPVLVTPSGHVRRVEGNEI